MADLTQARPLSPLGDADQVQIPIIQVPMSANLQIWGGGMVASDTSGNLVKADAATAVIVLGTARKNVNNLTSNPPFGAAGAIVAEVILGVQPMNISTDGGTITNANRYQDVFVVDDQTISLSDAGGTRLRAGYLFNIDPTSGLANVMFGDATPTARAASTTGGLAGAFKARNVVTSLQAYTGSGTGTLTETANGAWAAQDGVTNVVGDVVFIFATTTNLVGALDSGPWQISSLGSAGSKWVLIRPDWWINGTTMPLAATIDIGGEGTAWAGNSWRSFAAVGSQVIGTNDPTFYPRIQQVTTAAMTAGVSPANSTLFVRNANTQIQAAPITPGGTQGTLRISTRTAGYPGTSSVVVTSSSGTDTSTVQIMLENF